MRASDAARVRDAAAKPVNEPERPAASQSTAAPAASTDATPLPPAGWYPDPSGRHDWRWFDEDWTPYVSDAGQAFKEES